MFHKHTRFGERLKALGVSLATAGAATAVVLAPTPVLATGSEGFTSLESGFTQTLFGTNDQFLGGFAFAPNGDVWADYCGFSNGVLDRYSLTSTTLKNGSTLHSHSPSASNAGCGLTNNPDGTLYANTSDGVANLDANSAAQIGSPFGPAGNVLGITTDPVTNNLVYVQLDGTIGFVGPASQSPRLSGTFSTATTGHFIDGIAFNPTGDFLFVSDRSNDSLTIIKRDGSLAQAVPVGHTPDGIAFHGVAPLFVVTNDLDGTMTRFDFPGNDYTQTATVSSFASGGFRGDLTQVGPDGCLYVTQQGTRYADATVTGENSILQICGGFAPPPGVKEQAVTATGTTINATEGANFTSTVATFTDPDAKSTAAEYSATIDWGDGTTATVGTVSGPTGGPFTVSGSHTYAEEGTYQVTVTITDIDTTDNTATANSTANVADAALTAKPACSATSLLSYNGPTATFTDAASPFGTLSDFSATINWGDSTTTGGTVTGFDGGPYTVSGSHTYATTGTFLITTTINDVGGSTVTTSCNTLGFSFAPGGGSFVIGDKNATIGTSVTFWSAQWWKLNSLSGGNAPASFKGFAENPSTPACGTGWSTDPGNSTPPPAGPLPAFMGVIVTSSSSQNGSAISGNTVHIVIVQTNAGYAPDAGHAGTGTVVSVVC
jgi:hypothetical protein